MNYTIKAYSTALFSTFIFIEELGLLFDAGDGLSALLGQKLGKIKHVFISHADRDHLTGLLQFHQLNARPSGYQLYYPKDSGSFPALRDFCMRFDPHVPQPEWRGVSAGDSIPLNKQLYVQTIKNGHVQKGDLDKSFSFKVIEQKQKLKEEFIGINSQVIKQLVETRGRDFITEKQQRCIIGYSGDSPVEDYDRWEGCELLIHEATFIEELNHQSFQAHGNKHSTLEQVLTMAKEINLPALILNHFSSRYNKKIIVECIKKQCKKLNLDIPIYLILPNKFYSAVLEEDKLC